MLHLSGFSPLLLKPFDVGCVLSVQAGDDVLLGEYLSSEFFHLEQTGGQFVPLGLVHALEDLVLLVLFSLEACLGELVVHLLQILSIGLGLLDQLLVVSALHLQLALEGLDLVLHLLHLDLRRLVPFLQLGVLVLRSNYARLRLLPQVL